MEDVYERRCMKEEDVGFQESRKQRKKSGRERGSVPRRHQKVRIKRTIRPRRALQRPRLLDLLPRRKREILPPHTSPEQRVLRIRLRGGL